jgi:PAS domain S-box-containing protein
LTARETDHFTAEHASTLQAFADLAAIAIQNAQLYNAQKQHTVELEERVLARTSELERERAQLAAILDAMGEGVFFLDNDNRIKYTNQALADLVGYSRAETDRDPVTTYASITAQIPDIETWYKAVEGTLARSQTWRGEIPLQRKDGGQFDAGITVSAVTRSDGQRIGRVELIRDISQEKELQEQKDRFIANASHELRTPLTNMRMRLYLAKKQPGTYHQHLPILEQIVERMQNLVDDLLDLSRFERGTFALMEEEVVLQDLIELVVMIQGPHAESKSIDLQINLPTTPLHILADSQRLTQVFTNLVANAINYTPEGGTIAIDTAVEHDRGQAYAVVFVKDSGVGIDPAVLAHIFEPFFRGGQSDIDGTGLGLTISKEIIDLHGGQLLVESEPGEGSTFIVKLAMLSRDQQHQTDGYS